jgi:hypothetical protein
MSMLDDQALRAVLHVVTQTYHHHYDGKKQQQEYILLLTFLLVIAYVVCCRSQHVVLSKTGSCSLQKAMLHTYVWNK